MKSIVSIIKIFIPFALGIGILWWMYRGSDWGQIGRSLLHLHWGWMLLSLAFGIVPLTFRALRWQLALRPLGEHPTRRICSDAIFISYAVAAFATQLPQFLRFLHTTGTSPHAILSRFTSTGYLVTALCLLLAVGFSGLLLWRVKAFQKGREKVQGFFDGIASLRRLEHPLLYLLYSIGIWAGYYLHFYLAFFCYDFTAGIDPAAALLIFSASTFAVLVPTPNGAGPWHFAVKTMLVLYGVAEAPAILFALVVHTLQTALVIVMGLVGWMDLNFAKHQPSNNHLL